MALAAALAFEGPRAGVRAGAVVVDHGLQDGSAEVADVAAAQCRSLGLEPVEVRTARVVPHGAGPEAAARRARYDALESCRIDLGATHLLLAHTRDDQAEQVLLGLLRGSGARSLAGMAPQVGSLLRPFLDVAHVDTEAACAAADLTPWRDPHNDDERYARVRARTLLADLAAHLGAGVATNLARTAHLLRDDNDALDAWARAALHAGRVDGSAHAGRVDGSAHAGRVDGSAHAGRVDGSAHAGRVDGSAHAGRVDGSAAIRRIETPGDKGLDAASASASAYSTSGAIEVATLLPLPRAVRTRVVRLLLLEAGADGGALAFSHLDEVDRLVTDWRGQGPIDVPGGLQVERRGGGLAIGARRPVE